VTVSSRPAIEATLKKRGLNVPPDRLADFCRRWKVAELALFGSILRDDFGPRSDIDVMVRFEATADWRYYHVSEMKEELERLFGRPVDLVERRVVEASENYIRRRQILDHALPVYVA
jgi:predicted nucleotidyltransferase